MSTFNTKTFIFGAGVGLLIGIGGAYLYLNSKLERRLESEIESIREYYKQKEEFDSIQAKHKSKQDDIRVKEYSAALKASQENNERMERIVSGIIDKEGYLKYHDISDSFEIEEVDIDQVENTKKGTIVSSDEYIEIEEEDDGLVERPQWTSAYELLDVEQMDEDYYEYDKTQLVYWAKEDILTSEDDEVLEDALDILGETGLMTLSSYDVAMDDGDSIYIRNNLRETDYAVLYQEASYFDHTS